MEEKILREMLKALSDIKESLSIGSIASIRGPVADPGPELGIHLPEILRHRWIRGPVADPSPWHLLDKARLAKLKIRNIETAIDELEKQIDMLKFERDLLKEEYKIK